MDAAKCVHDRLQSAMAPSHWAASAPLGIKLALMELLLAELEEGTSRRVRLCLCAPCPPCLAGVLHARAGADGAAPAAA